MEDDVDVNGSDRAKFYGAVAYAIMFAAYLTSLTILSILGVSLWYFFAILVIGFPVSGVTLSLLQGFQMQRAANTVPVEPPTPVRTKNDAGLDVIDL